MVNISVNTIFSPVEFFKTFDDWKQNLSHFLMFLTYVDILHKRQQQYKWGDWAPIWWCYFSTWSSKILILSRLWKVEYIIISRTLNILYEKTVKSTIEKIKWNIKHAQLIQYEAEKEREINYRGNNHKTNNNKPKSKYQ